MKLHYIMNIYQNVICPSPLAIVKYMGGGRTYNIYYIIHYMTLYNVYSKVMERGGRTLYLVPTGQTDTQTHTQTHRSTYRGGAHLKKWINVM